jgi:glyoxylase I family protein
VQVVGVQHVALTVDDTGAAMEFYDKLGFASIERPDFGIGGAWLRAGDAVVHLVELPGVPPHSLNHLALEVPDIEAAVSELRTKGLDVGDPEPVGDGSQQAFVKDPTGNLIELNQPG